MRKTRRRKGEERGNKEIKEVREKEKTRGKEI